MKKNVPLLSLNVPVVPYEFQNAKNFDTHMSTTIPTPLPQANIPKHPSEEQAEFIRHWNTKLAASEPEEILRWAVDVYASKLTMATALGNSGCVILSILAKLKTKIPIFNLDTGYQFPETLELLEQINSKYGLDVCRKTPELSVEEYESQNGGAVYRTDTNRCCYERKIQLLEQIAPHYDAWISGLRRDQSPTRANTPVVGWDAKFGLVKIAPLAFWTGKQVWSKIIAESIPYNKLLDQGYTSIGCAPCTRQTLPGEDERAGRWSGQAKTECGLHLVNQSLSSSEL
ncbi:MAG: phosphoadenylyl-sulfate reductase [Planctomycetaceae bacterium]|jgi:phosphoadenosine phosphosulfate reductase|nr:phosphoadenylyl-sulfate reductase [Planctomycetaceae bacterium]